MTRSISPLEFGSFTKGLMTDGSPLNQEPDSAREMSNFDLDIDGTIKRRQGLVKLSPAYDTVFTESVDSVLISPVGNYDNYKDVLAPSVQQFWWKGLGLTEEVDVNVTLIGDTLTFQKIGGSTLLGLPVLNEGVTSPSLELIRPVDRVLSLPITQIGKQLVVGQPGITFLLLDYNDGIVEVSSGNPLTVRDVWGVAMVGETGVDYAVGNNINTRAPRFDFAEPDFSMGYTYNLRNQGFNVARWEPDNSADSAVDPINSWLFQNELPGILPSMADSVSPYLYPDTSLTEATRDRFHAKDSFTDSPVSTRATRGAYLIKLGSRTESRKQAVLDGFAQFPSETSWYDQGLVDELASDESSAQEMPRALGEFAGRLWFGGFSGDGTGAHVSSPRLSNLLFFSQLNTTEQNLFKCHQEGDPTSKEAPDLVATDGGFVPILGMSGCGKLLEFSNSLLVFAKTGIWSITGTDAGGFSSTGYEVKKLSSTGTEFFNSITLSGDSITYLSGDGVYAIQRGEVGELRSGKISQGILDKFFNNLSSSKLVTAAAAYSDSEREVRWVMHDNEGSKELKFKMSIGAFSVNDYAGDLFDGGAAVPVSISPLPFTTTFDVAGSVVVGGDNVVASGDNVVSTYEATGDNPRDFLYLIAQKGTVAAQMQYGFATLEDNTFTDFSTFDIPADSSWSVVTGVDAAGTLLMSHYTGGDTQRHKGVTYLSMMFQKTETGFDENWVPIGSSSCLVQAQWDWSDSSISGKFGRQFQAYRHRRLFMPDTQDNFDNGYEVVTTKNKLRGKGKALSLKFETEPSLDCHILGWSMNMSIGNAV